MAETSPLVKRERNLYKPLNKMVYYWNIHQLQTGGLKTPEMFTLTVPEG